MCHFERERRSVIFGEVFLVVEHLEWLIENLQLRPTLVVSTLDGKFTEFTYDIMTEIILGNQEL